MSNRNVVYFSGYDFVWINHTPQIKSKYYNLKIYFNYEQQQMIDDLKKEIIEMKKLMEQR